MSISTSLFILLALAISPVLMFSTETQSVTPQMYTIRIDPNMSAKTYSATMEVQFSPSKDIDYLVVKIGDYKVENVQIDGYKDFQAFLYTPREILIMLERDTYFYAGETFTLHITYSGHFRHDQKGFYVSNYKDDNGAVVNYIATGFRGKNFHLGFPYLENFETYSIQSKLLVRKQDKYTVVASSWSKASLRDDGYIHFDHPSVHQLSLFIGKLNMYPTETGTFTHRVYYRKGNDDVVDSSSVITEFGLAILRSAEEYLGLKYPLDKIDCVVVPGIASSTRDSLSLVFFTEHVDILLASYDFDELNKLYSRRTVHEVLLRISQKMSFQFFGGMFEPEDLLDQKIVKAFGEFVAYKVLDKTFPQLKNTMDLMYLESVHQYLWEDMRNESFVLVHADYKPNSVRKRKVLALLRMFYDISDEILLRSMKKIMYSKTIGSTNNGLHSGVQILETMEQQYGFDESFNMLQQWNTTTGYPIVYVDYADGKINVQQTNFSSGDISEWYFPISFHVAIDDELVNVIPSQYVTTSEVSFDWYEPVKWLLANPRRSVPYRVNYDAENWNHLIEQLNSDDFGGIHYINRAQLIDDSMALAHAGYVDYRLAFDVAKYLRNEQHFLPWQVASRNFRFVYQKLEGSPVQKDLKDFIGHLILEGMMSHKNVELQRLAIEWGSVLEGQQNQQCKEKVDEHVKHVTVNPHKQLHVATRDVVCCAAIRTYDNTMLKHMWRFVGNTTDERDFWLRCHSCSFPLVVSLSLRDSLKDERKYMEEDDIPRLQRYFFEQAGRKDLERLIDALKQIAHEMQGKTFNQRDVYLGWLRGLANRLPLGLEEKFRTFIRDLKNIGIIRSDEKKELKHLVKKHAAHNQNYFNRISSSVFSRNDVN